MSMALTGNNGDNETNIGASTSLSYSLYDENNNEIPIVNLSPSRAIEFWIAKDTSVSIPSYQYVNAVNATPFQTQINSSLTIKPTISLLSGFLTTGFSLSGANVSVSVQIRPENVTLAYLVLLKFGDNPVLSTSYFDKMSVFCGNDLRRADNESFHLLFIDMSQVNAFKGYVGVSLLELRDVSRLNCVNKSFNSLDYLASLAENQTRLAGNQSSFSGNFWLRTFSSGCYYMDLTSNTWSSFGVEILPDSNLTHAHCVSSHLTTFAGGFVVLPNAIDFNYVWSHAGFLDNPVIYSTVIALVTMYVLLAIWTRYMDVQDEKKSGITLLGDLDKHLAKKNKYIYEIIAFTGARLNAGTSSKVFGNVFYFIESNESKTSSRPFD